MVERFKAKFDEICAARIPIHRKSGVVVGGGAAITLKEQRKRVFSACQRLSCIEIHHLVK
mgnify:CR=1